MSKGELFFKKLFFKFIYFWLHWVFVAAHGLSLFVIRRDSSLVGLAVFLLQGSSRCGAQAQKLWYIGLVALWHVGSWTRDRTCVA